MELIGNVQVLAQDIEIQADILTFIIEEESTSTFPVSGDVHLAESENQNRLPVTWSADSSIFYTHIREVILKGNVKIDLGAIKVSSDAARILINLD